MLNEELESGNGKNASEIHVKQIGINQGVGVLRL